MLCASMLSCLSISYSDKNEDVMERFGLGGYSVPFEAAQNRYFHNKIMIDHKTLSEKFDALCRNQERIRSLIQSHRGEMVTLSLKNRDAIAKILA